MKRLTFLAAVAGLTLFGVVIALSGAGEVMDAVASAGWASLLILAARAIAVAGAGCAWHLLFPAGRRLALRVCVLLRFVREGTNQLLPVAAIGGDFIGARLATFWRCDGALSTASVVADIAVQAGTQFVFAVLGLGLLVWLTGDSDLVRILAIGLAVAACLIGLFLLLQGRGGSRLLLALGQRIAGGRSWFGSAALERFYGSLRAIYADPGGLSGAVAIHMAVWVFGSVEVWVALGAMGHPVSVSEALVIESLGQAVRGAAFAIPGGLGVQEGGFIALCALFGIPAGPAVAVSLLKRLADVVLGLPGLVAWQVIESRRALSVRSSAPVEDGGALADAGR